MAKTLIIPGVQVTVVKDVVPQQLAPSGVLGLIGFTELGAGTVGRASSFSAMLDLFGPATAFSLPEARQAFDNGVSQLVISSLAGGTAAKVAVDTSTAGTPAFQLVARAPGAWANGLSVSCEIPPQSSPTVFNLHIERPGGGEEVYRNVLPSKLGAVLASSSLVELDPSWSGTLALPAATDPASPPSLLGGSDTDPTVYKTAIDALVEEPDVDMVLAAVQDFTSASAAHVPFFMTIYDAVRSHCDAMAADCKGRLGFGQIPTGTTLAKAAEYASSLVSDRFVLVAPDGVVGAVAGLIGGLDYFQSPTFKALKGAAGLTPLKVDDQQLLLTSHVVPVALDRSRGIIVIRGITTDGDQINVRRVADRAVRTLKSIGNLFIGLLNTADGRGALKQKLAEALLQMQKDGAIVPSTDGLAPAFTVDVFSSQADFALGIVRVSMAVRPVRAIDYIYATITVQV